jgi:hypothetical protein
MTTIEKGIHDDLLMSLSKNSIRQKICDYKDPVKLHLLTVEINRLVEFHRYEVYLKKREVSEKSRANLKTAYTKGELSIKTRQHIQEIIRNWYSVLLSGNMTEDKPPRYKHRNLVFLTLTLPAEQLHDDKKIKRVCLNDLLQRLRYQYNNFYYVWVSETQKNGNIHFHLVIDVYIDKDDIRKIWNECLEKLGYITEFEKKHHHRDPHTTMIEAVRNERQLGAYLSKYISKSGNSRKIEGRCWGCSEVLMKLEKCTLFVDSEIDDEISHYIETRKPRIVSEDYYYLIDIPDFYSFLLNCKRLKQEFITYWFEYYKILYMFGPVIGENDYRTEY